ncbi:MAG: TIM barrel protein [Bacillota bacterium]
MKLLSISNSNYHLKHFDKSWKNVEKFLNEFDLDGIELFPYKRKYIKDIKDKHLIGMHLKYYPTWLEFYKNDKKKLNEIFSNDLEIKKYYGSLDPSILVDIYRKEFERAKKLNVEYMVFHVSHIRPKDAFSFSYEYSNKEVIKYTIDLVNKVFDSNSNIELLFENLWWPGMNLLNKKDTKYLLENINYENKGIILDLSHLMITNPNLKNLDETTEYILNKIDELGELKKYIKGIHINSSLTGKYLKKDHKRRFKKINKIEDDYLRYEKIINHIQNIDKHLPFLNKGINKIIEKINPKYLVYEFKYKDIKQLRKFVKKQNEFINEY